MCWVAQTQLEVFQGIMGAMINPSLSEQIALLKEYYGAMRPREKSARRDSRYCARFRRMLEQFPLSVVFAFRRTCVRSG